MVALAVAARWRVPEQPGSPPPFWPHVAMTMTGARGFREVPEAPALQQAQVPREAREARAPRVPPGSTGSSTGSTSLVFQPTDETSKGQSGGIYPHNHGDLEFNIDPVRLIAPTSFALAMPVYSTWVKFGKTVPPDRPTAAMIAGDAMRSWEFAPDGLSATYKLRQDLKFDPRPPTNNRAMTVDDVKWTFDQTEQLSPLGGVVFRSAGQAGVIDTFEAIDAETIKINLAEPYGAINEILAYGYLYVAPTEGEDQIDLRSEMRGTGPFRLDELQTGILARYSKNPDWYEDGHPFLDGMEYRFIGEQSVIDTQFEAKKLWESGANTLPTDILRLKDEHPELLMMQDMPRLSPGGYPMNLGTAFAGDERLRRAASMVIDRDAMIRAVYSTRTWEDRGIEVPLIWDGHLSSNAATWIDPKTDGAGAWGQVVPVQSRRGQEASRRRRVRRKDRLHPPGQLRTDKSWRRYRRDAAHGWLQRHRQRRRSK